MSAAAAAASINITVEDAVRLLRGTRHQYRFERADMETLRAFLSAIQVTLGADGYRFRWRLDRGASAIVWLDPEHEEPREAPADFA